MKRTTFILRRCETTVTVKLPAHQNGDEILLSKTNTATGTDDTSPARQPSGNLEIDIEPSVSYIESRRQLRTPAVKLASERWQTCDRRISKLVNAGDFVICSCDGVIRVK